MKPLGAEKMAFKGEDNRLKGIPIFWKNVDYRLRPLFEGSLGQHTKRSQPRSD
jgi:hypothetical protein